MNAAASATPAATVQYQGATPRPFNYLWVEAKPDALHIQVRGFDKGETVVRELDSFRANYANEGP